jgi:hypothetical protein
MVSFSKMKQFKKQSVKKQSVPMPRMFGFITIKRMVTITLVLIVTMMFWYYWIVYLKTYDLTLPPEAFEAFPAIYWAGWAFTGAFTLVTAFIWMISRRKPSRLAHMLFYGLIMSVIGTAFMIQAFATPVRLRSDGKTRVNQVPIRVADRGTGVDVYAVIDAWNKLAGTDIFIHSATNPTVVFAKSPRQPYTYVSQTNPGTCYIYVGRNYGPQTWVMQHEIGHCLGLADHIRVSDTYKPTNKNYIAVCGAPWHPKHSSYSGIMSYCDFFTRRNWFGAHDKETLVKHGYAKESVQ